MLIRMVLLSMAVALASGTTALAQDKRLVLKGYDPVAYFTEQRPVKGSPQFAHEWDGERYHFASAANRAKFAADPERYVPQFGGYCTGSMARNVQVEADPQAWVISGGKLYVFGQTKFADMARKDPQWLATRIPVAAANWSDKRK